MKNNHGFSNILVISILLILLFVGGYFGYSYLSKPNNTNRIQSENTPGTQDKSIENTVNPQEWPFVGIDNCPVNECKNLEVISESDSIQFEDKEFGKLYKNKEYLNINYALKFNKNYIYFTTSTFNEETMEVSEEKIYSFNINNGVITELMSLESKINSYLVAGNNIYYSIGKTCGEVCAGPENTYGHKLYSYNIDTKETIKLNSKNLTESGYVVKAPDDNKFNYESGRINIYQLENNKLVMSFGQMIQPVEWFFYFDLDTKQVTNIDGNKQYFGEELNRKRKELGALSGWGSKLFIRNGNFEIVLE